MSTGNMTTFGPEGAVDDVADVEAPEGDATAEQPEGQEESAQEQRERHSRTRAHDERGRFAGPPPEVKEKKPEPKKEEPKPPPAPARLKLKVPKEDGEGEEELDLSPEEAGQRLAEARKLAKEREQERQAREKAEGEAVAFRRLLSDLKAGKNRGQAVREFARQSGMSREEVEDTLAEALHEEMQESQLTDEQRELRDLRAREAQRQEDEKRQKAEESTRKFSETTRAKAEEYGKVWGEALAKTGLPPSPSLLADVGRYHIINKRKGLSLTADELASYASGEFDRKVQLRLKDVPPEEIAKRFPDVAKAWDSRIDAMDPEAFLVKHPEAGKKLLRHFREKARSRPAPGVGASRPAAPSRSAPKPAEEDAPSYFDPWAIGRGR